MRGGEILLCVRGSTGTVSVASTELSGANVTRGIVPIRFDRNLLTQDFGYYVMTSGEIQEQIREKTYGAALMQINIRDLRQVTLFVPFRETSSSWHLIAVATVSLASSTEWSLPCSLLGSSPSTEHHDPAG